MDVLAGEVGDGHVLLVLDNFEQVTEAGPDVAELLRRCQNLKAIVTTRIPLRVSGEQEYPVPGLPAPPDTTHLSEMERLNLPRELRELDLDTLTQFEAVRLFIARATAVRPSFEVTNANAPAVAGIAARLHGMPLAIELAAARVKLLTPDQILARLEHHLDLLSAGSRDLPERQQTLRGAIGWSYDLLDDGSRRLVDRLSVFRGGFDLEMAERVCGPADEVGGDVVERVGELVDQSLVRLDETHAEPRFAMLETIREYAAEMLAGRGDAEAIADRHASAMLELAQEAAPRLSGGDQRMWLDRLERDHDNMRAALDWAVAKPDPPLGVRLASSLWRFWQQRGYLNEARARFEQLEAKGWSLDPVDQARFAEAYGGIAYWQSDAPTARRQYDEASAALARDRGQAGAGQCALQPSLRRHDRDHGRDRGTARAGRGRPDAGAGRGPRDLPGARRHGGRGKHPVGTWERLLLHRERDRGGVVVPPLPRAASHRRQPHDGGVVAPHARAVDPRSAPVSRGGLEVVRHALRHFYEAGDVVGVTLVLDDLAIVAVGLGDPERAGRLWGAARHLQQRTGTGLADYVQQNNTLFGVPDSEGRGPARPARDARGGRRGDVVRRGRRVRIGGPAERAAGAAFGGSRVIEATSVGYPAIAIIDEDDLAQAADATEAAGTADVDPGTVILTCANCGAQMDERKCKLICRCGYFLSCSDYY